MRNWRPLRERRKVTPSCGVCVSDRESLGEEANADLSRGAARFVNMFLFRHVKFETSWASQRRC